MEKKIEELEKLIKILTNQVNSLIKKDAANKVVINRLRHKVVSLEHNVSVIAARKT